MPIFRFLFTTLFLLLTLHLNAEPFSNVLIYDDPVQVTSSINQYESLVANVPIQGTIMVTHNAKNPIDPNSFRLGYKILKTKLVQEVPLSPDSNLIISIYAFTLRGFKRGSHTLPPINVMVGGKRYQAPPLQLQIASQ